MSDFTRIAAVDDLPPGKGMEALVGDRAIALFNVDGTFYALDNACPHRGGPLGEGELEGTVAVCPWHAWRWDVKTGANVNNPAVKTACFPASVDGGSVYVELP